MSKENAAFVQRAFVAWRSRCCSADVLGGACPGHTLQRICNTL
jgi:hypothetical protein